MEGGCVWQCNCHMPPAICILHPAARHFPCMPTHLPTHPPTHASAHPPVREGGVDELEEAVRIVARGGAGAQAPRNAAAKCIHLDGFPCEQLAGHLAHGGAAAVVALCPLHVLVCEEGRPGKELPHGRRRAAAPQGVGACTGYVSLLARHPGQQCPICSRCDMVPSSSSMLTHRSCRTLPRNRRLRLRCWRPPSSLVRSCRP